MVIDVSNFLLMIDWTSIKNTLKSIVQQELIASEDKKKKSKITSEDLDSIEIIINTNEASISVSFKASENVMEDEVFTSNTQKKLQTLAPQYIEDEIYTNKDLVINQAKPQIVDYVKTVLGGALS